MLKKAVCIVIALLVMLATPTMAWNGTLTSSQARGFTAEEIEGEVFVYKDTNEYIAIAGYEEDGRLSLSLIRRTDGTVVRIENVNDIECVIDAWENGNLNYYDTTVFADESVLPLATKSVSSGIANAIADEMSDVYGAEYYNDLIDYEYFSDIGVRFNVRESLLYDAEDTGWLTLQRGLTTAEAIAKYASKINTPYKTVLKQMKIVLDATGRVVDGLLEEEIILSTYRGVALFERMAWIKEDGTSSDTPYYVSSTRSEIWHFFVERSDLSSGSSDPASRLTLTEDSEYTMYVPSEYEYETTVIIEDAYDLYVG